MGITLRPRDVSSTSSLSSSLTDTFGQSRTHYQPGYMMVSHPNQSPLFFTDPPSQSAQQPHVHAPQNAQHADEIPTVQTKAKMNLALSRGGAPTLGPTPCSRVLRRPSRPFARVDRSAFLLSCRQRQAFADTDAPPTTSIHDVFRESPFGTSERAPPRVCCSILILFIAQD